MVGALVNRNNQKNIINSKAAGSCDSQNWECLGECANQMIRTMFNNDSQKWRTQRETAMGKPGACSQPTSAPSTSPPKTSSPASSISTTAATQRAECASTPEWYCLGECASQDVRRLFGIADKWRNEKTNNNPSKCDPSVSPATKKITSTLPPMSTIIPGTSHVTLDPTPVVTLAPSKKPTSPIPTITTISYTSAPAQKAITQITTQKPISSSFEEYTKSITSAPKTSSSASPTVKINPTFAPTVTLIPGSSHVTIDTTPIPTRSVATPAKIWSTAAPTYAPITTSAQSLVNSEVIVRVYLTGNNTNNKKVHSYITYLNSSSNQWEEALNVPKSVVTFAQPFVSFSFENLEYYVTNNIPLTLTVKILDTTRDEVVTTTERPLQQSENNIEVTLEVNESTQTITSSISLTPVPIMTLLDLTSPTDSSLGGYIYYAQCGEPYGSYLLPIQNGAEGEQCTECSAGCGPTTAAMIISSYVDSTQTPPKVIESMSNAGVSISCDGTGMYQLHEYMKNVPGIKVSDIISLGNAQAKDVVGDFRNYTNGGWTLFTVADFKSGAHYFWVTDVTVDGKILAFDSFYGSGKPTPFDENQYDPYPYYIYAFAVKKI